MDYSAYRTFRAETLANDPSIADLGQTNIWRALAHLVPPTPPPHDGRIHRCHLAQQWVKAHGLPAEYSDDTIISSGVRHSLSLLFPELATRNTTLCIPSDVYPVYGQIAALSGLAPSTFQTTAGLALPDSSEWLLLPNPIKPAGRWLCESEITALRKWLACKPQRRLLLDTVYNLQPKIHASTLRLFATGQVFVLHSLSKAWLHPQVMGICLTPQADREWVKRLFHDHAPLQPQLRAASSLLRNHARAPQHVDGAIQSSRSRMLCSLPSAVRKECYAHTNASGYFVTVQKSHMSLLKEHGILAIPQTVFGSDSTHFSVLSSLVFASRR